MARPGGVLSGPDRARELDAALARIDAVAGAAPLARRVLRAAACYNHGDAARWHREDAMAVAEAAEAVGLAPRDVDALIIPAGVRAARDGRRRAEASPN